MGRDKTLLAGIELGLDVLGSSTQWAVAGAVGVALITRADVDTLVYVLGSLINAVFSKVLKKTINQVRPDGAQLSDPGMPSSHAMTQTLLGMYALTASLWRVKAGFHTLPQVAVGAAVGAVDAVLWYHLCHPYLLSQARLGVVCAVDAAGVGGKE
ncbi:conserved unknown protein [Ectocarpus siliculosus]|uniref:Dolichyldiphosphatase n=1 Tax=Ectocarpus siliculosus TaxID=2880 RepID=D7FNW3_ECTSI|nr:conserved unknown protein [Ectocarpus siliculosus]|eukprot:CBJ30239.1 conserved unknown protein [Ectocarpus siliculosus]